MVYQWIGLREKDNRKAPESPIFNGKIYGFRLRFPLNQSIDISYKQLL